VRDPGCARCRCLPQAEQFAGQPVPGQPQQRGGALLLVQAALRGQPRLRGGKAFAPQRTLFFESLAHAGTRVGMGLCPQRGGTAVRIVEDRRAPFRTVGLDEFEQRACLVTDVHGAPDGACRADPLAP